MEITHSKGSPFHGKASIVPKEAIKAAKQDIAETVSSSFEALQSEAARTHADILLGDRTDASYPINRLQVKVRQAKAKLEQLKSQYGFQSNNRVQELLVKGELQVAQLERAVEALQVFNTPEGKHVLKAKKEVIELLGQAHKKPKEAACLLVEAQKKLHMAFPSAGNVLLAREMSALQRRLGYQANWQLTLTAPEAKLFKTYQEQDHKLKLGSKSLERYCSVVSKIYATRFINGSEGRETDWLAAQELGGQAEIRELVVSFTKLHRGTELKLMPKELVTTSAGALIKKMHYLAKECLKSLDELQVDKHDLVQNPSDGLRERLELGTKSRVDRSQEQLAKYEESMAFLSAKGQRKKLVKRLEAKRAEILASIAVLHSTYSVLGEASQDIRNAILGLEQHKVLQEIFSSLRRVRVDKGVQLDAGAKVPEVRKALDKLISKRGTECTLVHTLKQQFTQIAADALSSKSGSKKLLSGIKKVSSSEERAFKRFVSVLSLQVEAYAFATETTKSQIESNMARLQEAIDANPKLKNDLLIQELMRNWSLD